MESAIEIGIFPQLADIMPPIRTRLSPYSSDFRKAVIARGRCETNCRISAIPMKCNVKS